MKKMKKILISVFAGLTAVLMLAGCSQQPAPSSQPSQSQASAAAPSESEAPAPESPAFSESVPVPAGPEGGKTLVLYFSASGNTKAVAETIAEAAGAEIYELTPAEPYTDADLDWTNQTSRRRSSRN